MRKFFPFIAVMCCAVMMNATEGVLPGRFTINKQGDQIRFSQGNLQYQQATQTWQFAENQWDFLFDANNQASFVNLDNVIDLYGWGTGDRYAIGVIAYAVKDDKQSEYGFALYEFEIPVKPEELEPLPNDEETTFDFSLYDPTGEEMLGVTLGAQDRYNEEEGCIEVASTNTAEEIDAKLNEAFEGAASIKSLLPGTITLELEPGGGEMIIDCKTVPGYSLYVRIAEYGAAYISSTIEQAMRGKATVTYEVHQKTYVVIYLDGAPAASAPARIASADHEEGAGAYIYGISVKPSNSTTGVDQVQGDKISYTKLLREGAIYILRGDKLYTVTGQIVQ